MWCFPQIGTFFGLLIFFAPIENTKRKKYWSQCSSSCLHRTTLYTLKVQQYYANLVNWIFPDYLLFLKGGSALERNKINRPCSESWKKCNLREVTKWLLNEWFCNILQKWRTIDHSSTDWFYLLLITLYICQRLYYDKNHIFKFELILYIRLRLMV